ncbi:SLATT domain-containing protein [Clostridium paridis]|uniref:SLATT domain-containing protein n=1 Tax=Clostridium paridis TaxID=2803863 RepID=A0A937FDQ0_9CLOT|nr:SLATT domain-containing protein [Clostridium paridis]MBL4930940.1 SLATT domain-containing protein [Clostridium paridis]
MEVDFSNKKGLLELNKSKKENADLLEELKRRVDITYRTRIISTNRLREKHNEYKKLNIYYSALITGISILSIGIDIKISKISISNIVLMFSIVLTYFMFYISEQNLQERAYKMEETFKSLDKLKNKINITLQYNQSNITQEICKKLYKEYEAIISSIENHEEIDFDMYRLSYFKKEGVNEKEEDLYLEIKGRVEKYQRGKKLKMYFKYLAPLFAGIGVIVVSVLK